MMTLRDLIDTLSDIATEHGDDAEVRLAIQPRWAFEHSIDEVVAVDMNAPDGDSEDGAPAAARATTDDDDPNVVVYIGECSQLGYLPGAASQALGWR
jgi:hypothetical protein